MTAQGFALFGTTIGECGIAWSQGGIVGVQLPESTADRTRARLVRQFPGTVQGEPPAPVRDAIAGIVSLLEGDRVDLSSIAVDLTAVPAFHRRVYEVVRAIPAGDTLTYGEVADRVSEPRAAQAVGQALGRNPVPIIVACHRVLAASGKIGGFSATGGALTKRRILAIEGALAPEEPTLF